jgi:hypothetical protein
MSAEKTLMTYAELVQALSVACQKALRAGMSREVVKTVLDNLGELIDNAEDE